MDQRAIVSCKHCFLCTRNHSKNAIHEPCTIVGYQQIVRVCNFFFFLEISISFFVYSFEYNHFSSFFSENKWTRFFFLQKHWKKNYYLFSLLWLSLLLLLLSNGSRNELICQKACCKGWNWLSILCWKKKKKKEYYCCCW